VKFSIHFFNVEHGDSILIEIEDNKENYYILIDSKLIKTNNEYINPAYEFLKSKNVNILNGLIVSHFHKDHISGIEYFFDKSHFTIEKIYIPPVLSGKSEVFDRQIQKFKDKIVEVLNQTTDELILKQTESFTQLIAYLTQNDETTQELFGPETILRIPGITIKLGVVYLPLKKIKGTLYQKIEKGNFELDHFPEMNQMSIVVLIDIFGQKILLAADSTIDQWIEHMRQMRGSIGNLGISFLKAPHHGSKHNNTKKLYEYFFDNFSENKYIFISSNGISHPHKEIFELINEFKLQPFCTNLSDQCISRNVSLPTFSTDIPSDMKLFLAPYVESKPTQCQGDISLIIDDKGYCIESSTNTPCPYRMGEIVEKFS
jgi:beta-lactamase superfamily II metal-dependent hydrolase